MCREENILQIAIEMAACAVDAWTEQCEGGWHSKDNPILQAYVGDLIKELRGIPASKQELEAICNLDHWDLSVPSREKANKE